jgi:hypothetical protein
MWVPAFLVAPVRAARTLAVLVGFRPAELPPVVVLAVKPLAAELPPVMVVVAPPVVVVVVASPVVALAATALAAIFPP